MSDLTSADPGAVDSPWVGRLLAESDAAFVTGTELVIDGGICAG